MNLLGFLFCIHYEFSGMCCVAKTAAVVVMALTNNRKITSIYWNEFLVEFFTAFFVFLLSIHKSPIALLWFFVFLLYLYYVLTRTKENNLETFSFDFSFFRFDGISFC